MKPLSLLFCLGVACMAQAQEPRFLHQIIQTPNQGQHEHDEFGASLSADGNFIAIGSPRASVLDTPEEQGEVCLYESMVTARAVLGIHRVYPNPNLSGLRFGHAVALSGRYLLVGAPENPISGVSLAGEAYLFDRLDRETTPVSILVNPNPEGFERFGIAVAHNGVFAAVSARGLNTAADGKGVVHIFYRLLNGAPLLRTINNPNPAAGGHFGATLAMDGNFLVVGDPTADGGRGVTYVFNVSSGELIRTFQSPAPPGEHERFGAALSMKNYNLAIGAPEANGQQGRVYVYRFTTTTPTAPAFTIENPTPGIVGEGFGTSVAIHFPDLLVGNPGDVRDVANQYGSAHRFDLSSPTPTIPVFTNTSDQPVHGESFGSAVALIKDIDASLSFVGVPRNSHDAGGAGAVARWVHGARQPSWTYPKRQRTDSFGAAVAMDGSRTAVGAPFGNMVNFRAGRVNVYDRNSSSPASPWLTLGQPDGKSNDRYGHTVVLKERHLAVAAPYRTIGAAYYTGIVYVYDLEGPLPSSPAHLIECPNPLTTYRPQLFGRTMDLDQGLLAVTAQGSSQYPGKVYVYDLASSTPTAPRFTLPNSLVTPTPGNQTFGDAVAMSGSRLAVSSPTDNTNPQSLGRIFIYDLASQTPLTPVLTIPSPYPGFRNEFGMGLAFEGDRLVTTVMKTTAGGTRLRTVLAYDLASDTPTTPAFELGTLPDDVPASFATELELEGDTIIAQYNNTLRRYDWSSTPPGQVVQVFDGDGGTATALAGGWLASGNEFKRYNVFMWGEVRIYSPPYAEIALSGNSNNIVSGDTSPDLLDHTDFGRVSLGGSLRRYFKVENLGPSELTFTNAPIQDFTLSGADAAHFSIVEEPVNPLPGGAAGTLVIQFTPLDEGVKTAQVTVRSGDSDEPAFTFTITGEGRLTSPAGEIWTEQPASGHHAWTGLSTSADGRHIFATSASGHILRSGDFGISWNQAGGGLPCAGVASSADGSRVALAVEGGPIYVSSDAGANWTPVENARSWAGIACSADGQKLVAVETGGLIYLSNDQGVTWTSHEQARAWCAVACSADAARLVALAQGGQIYVSRDGGATWTAYETDRVWTQVACSADGVLIAAVADNAPIVISSDGGETWTTRENQRAWTGVAISGNGAQITACSSGMTGRIYVSQDGGLTWAPKAHEADWSVLTSSSDGSLLAAGVNNQSIWTSTGVVDPLLTVRGNGLLIANDDLTPEAADGTDMGATPATAGIATQTFVIANPGPVPLHLTDVPPVKISGLNAGDFTVEHQPATTVAPFGGSTNFTIRFDPAALGERTATVSLASDDSDQNPHSFAIRGTGILATYTITPQPGPRGAISPPENQQVLEGGTRTFTATPDEGFMVDRWLVNGVEAQVGGTTFTTPPVLQSALVMVHFMPNPEAPEFVAHPQHALAYLGGAATFAPEVEGGQPMTYQWKKGGANLSNANAATLTLANTASTDIGAYTVVVDNEQGAPVSSLPAYLGLVTPAAPAQAVRRGSTLTLRCTATAPAATGVSLGYRWHFNGEPLVDGTLPNGSVVANSTKATMTLSKADFAHEGTYACMVTLNTPGNDPTLSAGDIQVSVLGDLPVMDAIPLPTRVMVSQTLEGIVTASEFPTSFSAAGLPIGLTFDTRTGRISGKPRKASKKDAAGNYIADKVSFRATNAWGLGPITEYLLVVEALPDSLVGNFNGIVARSPHTNFNHGGQVQFTIATNGIISGTATLAGQRHTVNGSLDTGVGSLTTANFSFLRSPSKLRNLTLEITFPGENSPMQGLFTDPSFVRLEGRLEAGQPSLPGLVDAEFEATTFRLPSGVCVGPNGVGYIADTGNNAIRIFDLNTRVVATLAGNGTVGTADGMGAEATFNAPQAIAMDSAGNLYVADTGNHAIRKITPEGLVSTFSGAPGQPGSQNGTVSSARFNKPTGLCFDASGNLYVVDQGNHVIRKITPAGAVTTHAGMAGVAAHKEGMGSAARFNTPTGITFDPTLKYLFVTDTGNNIVRQVALNGATYTYAGSPGAAGADDGLAANARFHAPLGIVARGDGTIYVSDTVIRQINPNGTVGTVTARVKEDDHPVALAWHAETASLLAVHDTLHAFSIQQLTTHDRDAVFTAWRNGWTGGNTVPVEERARYNVVMETSAQPYQRAFPLGTGYASVTLSAQGTATWAGKTADGIAFTSSSVMTPDKGIPLHAMMLMNTASVQGETVLSPTTLTLVTNESFYFDWLKVSQPISRTDVSYKTGFPLHALKVFGGKFTPGNLHSYLGLPSNPAAMTLNFAESRNAAFTQGFTLSSPNKVTIPANTRNVILSINATTGIFSGTFRDGTPSLTANYAGILFDDPTSGEKRGQGYVLLPDTPGTLRPVESSAVTLQVAP